MPEFRTKVSENGRVVIPAECRRKLHIKPGEELIFRIEKGEIRLFSVKHSLKKAQSLVQKHSHHQSLVKKLKKMRQEDADDE